MKNAVLFTMLILLSANVFAKEVNIIVKDPIVSPHFPKRTLASAKQSSVHIYLANCTKKTGDVDCDNLHRFEVIRLGENATDEPFKHDISKILTFDTDDLSEEEKNSPGIGLYFRVYTGNRGETLYSNTGLLGECIRHVAKGEKIGLSCESVRAGQGVSLELKPVLVKQNENGPVD